MKFSKNLVLKKFTSCCWEPWCCSLTLWNKTTLVKGLNAVNAFTLVNSDSSGYAFFLDFSVVTSFIKFDFKHVIVVILLPINQTCSAGYLEIKSLFESNQIHYWKKLVDEFLWIKSNSLLKKWYKSNQNSILKMWFKQKSNHGSKLTPFH